MKIDKEAQQTLALGCVWVMLVLALTLGIGGCIYLTNVSEAERKASKSISEQATTPPPQPPGE